MVFGLLVMAPRNEVRAAGPGDSGAASGPGPVAGPATGPGPTADTPEQVAASAWDIRPLLIGSEVPEVTVQDVESNHVSLRDAMGGKPTVLVFYRGGW
jgi:hypothetical protein